LDKVAAAKTVTLASNSALGTTYTVGATELNAVDNIVFTGDNNVTLSIDLTEIEAANADTSGGTSAAAVIATDNSSATTRITLTESIANLTNSQTLDLSKLAVDELALGSDSTIGTAEVLKVASGQNVVIASDQTSLNLTSAAVAGNTITLTVEDDSTATDTNVYEFGDITLTNFATVTIDAQDTESTLSGGDNGTATLTDDTGLKIDAGTAAVIAKGAGNMLIDEVVAASFNASQSTGNIDFTLDEDEVLNVTGGAGNDTFTDSDGNAAPSYVLDGGDGVDTFVASNNSYKAASFSMTNIEKIDVTAGDATFLDTQMTGKTLVVVADNATDELKIDTGATGGTIDVTNMETVTAAITLTGGAGADTLTGSATSATTINAAGGGDVINAGNGGSTIDAAGGNDQITTGTGTDSVTVGDGTDTVTIVADTAVDTVVFDSLTGQNTVTGFDTAEDKIDLDSLGAVANTAAGGTAVTAGAVTAGAITDNSAYVINNGAVALTAAGSETIADYTDLTDVAAYLNEGYTSTAAADEGQFLINDLVGGKTYLYHFLEGSGGASTISSAELTLVATITEETGSAIVAGDVV
jgi:S-layer protein